MWWEWGGGGGGRKTKNFAKLLTTNLQIQSQHSDTPALCTCKEQLTCAACSAAKPISVNAVIKLVDNFGWPNYVGKMTAAEQCSIT